MRAGDTIYIPTAIYHSTVNTGWEPLVLLAIYNPGGAERALKELPRLQGSAGRQGAKAETRLTIARAHRLAAIALKLVALTSRRMPSTPPADNAAR